MARRTAIEYRDLTRETARTRLYSLLMAENLKAPEIIEYERNHRILSEKMDHFENYLREATSKVYEETMKAIEEADEAKAKTENLREERARLSSKITRLQADIAKIAIECNDLAAYKELIIKLLPHVDNQLEFRPEDEEDFLRAFQKIKDDCLLLFKVKEARTAAAKKFESDFEISKKNSESKDARLRNELAQLRDETMKDDELSTKLKEQTIKLLDHTKRTFDDHETARLHVDVEMAYKTCVVGAVAEAGLVEMFRAISAVAIAKMTEIDELPAKLVLAADAQIGHRDMVAMQEAQEATKQLKRIKQMERSFLVQKPNPTAIKPLYRPPRKRKISQRQSRLDRLTSLQAEFSELFSHVELVSQAEFFSMYPNWKYEEYLKLTKQD